MPRVAPETPEQAREQAMLAERIDELTFGAYRGAKEPTPAPSGLPRLRRLLVGIGPDRATDWALSWAEALGPIFEPHVALVHVEQPLALNYANVVSGAPLAPGPEVAREQAAWRDRRLAEGVQRMRDAGLDATARHAAGSIVRELADVALEERADLVIVGSPTRGPVDRFLLGSVADGVKNHVETNVLLAKTPALPGDVLCPVDGSALSHRAAALALRIARAWGSRLHVLFVLEPPAGLPPTEADADLRHLQARLDLPWDALRDVEFRILVGDARERILQEAEGLAPQLIVIGNRGLGGLRSLVAGSITNHLAHHTARSLLLVKARET